MKKRHTEEHIIKVIKKYEAGAKVEDICRDAAVTARSTTSKSPEWNPACSMLSPLARTLNVAAGSQCRVA